MSRLSDLRAAYDAAQADPENAKLARALWCAAVSAGMSLNCDNPKRWAFGKLARSGK